MIAEELATNNKSIAVATALAPEHRCKFSAVGLHSEHLTLLLLCAIIACGCQRAAEGDQMEKSELVKLFKVTTTSYRFAPSGRVAEVGLAMNADFVLSKLRPFDGLAKLDSWYALNDVSATGLNLLTQAKELRVINLAKRDLNAIPVESFSVFGSLPQLEELRIQTGDSFDMDAAMKYIATVSRLRVLAINAQGISAAGLQYLPNLQNLEHLTISGTNRIDAGIRFIAELENLKELSLEDAPISDEGLREIGKLRRLQALYLGSSKITDTGLKSIYQLTDLRDLSLSKSQVTDESLEWIASLPELEFLFLSETAVTDSGIAHLVGHPRLRSVVLFKTRVTADGARQLLNSLKARGADVAHESIEPRD
jgi:hypothetical protein